MRVLLALTFGLLLCACQAANTQPQWISTDPADVNPIAFRAQIRVAGAGDFQTFYGPLPASYPVRYEGQATITFQTSLPLVVVDGEGDFILEPFPDPASVAFMQREMAVGRFVYRMGGRPVGLYPSGTIESRRRVNASPYVAGPKPVILDNTEIVIP